MQKNSTLQRAVFFLSLLTIAPAAFCAASDWDFQVVRTYPHDTAHFTQGLVLHDGTLIEGTGGYGDSALYQKSLDDGSILREHHLPSRYFGEGVAVIGEEIWQLTWREGRAFVYDFKLQPLRSFPLSGEGWGLTAEGTRIWMSDGSADLIELDHRDGRELRRIRVIDGRRPVRLLNELEFVNGLIFANVFLRDDIAIIRPEDGQVIGWLRLADLRERFPPPPGFNRREHVLNGIAWDAENGHLLVTGKCWPLLFALRLIPPDGVHW